MPSEIEKKTSHQKKISLNCLGLTRELSLSYERITIEEEQNDTKILADENAISLNVPERSKTEV